MRKNFKEKLINIHKEYNYFDKDFAKDKAFVDKMKDTLMKKYIISEADANEVINLCSEYNPKDEADAYRIMDKIIKLKKKKGLIERVNKINESVKAQGYDQRTINDVKTQLDKEVKAGKISQDEADDYLEAIKPKNFEIWDVEDPESAGMTEKDYLEMWQYLVDSGLAWSLQGWYGRTARDLLLQKKIKATTERAKQIISRRESVVKSVFLEAVDKKDFVFIANKIHSSLVEMRQFLTKAKLDTSQFNKIRTMLEEELDVLEDNLK